MILFYDTETTGLPRRGKPLDDRLQPRIVQLGAILDDNEGNEVMRLDVILKLPNLPEEVNESWDHAANIHGISRALSERIGVYEPDALNLFLDMLDAADVVVGQNIVGFDNDIVTGCTRRALKDPALTPFKDKKVFDTMKAGAALMKRTSGKVSLTALHTYLFGEAFEGAHRAISDVKATRRCFYRLQEIVRERAS